MSTTPAVPHDLDPEPPVRKLPIPRLPWWGTLATNALGAGLGVGAGYMLGGGAVYGLSRIPQARDWFNGLTPEQRTRVLHGVYLGASGIGGVAGSIAGAAANRRLAEAWDKDKHLDEEQKRKHDEWKQRHPESEKVAHVLQVYNEAERRLQRS